jgi:5-oxopent-3-ene-1,2,5-tricarboxylate decarboxylase/2-hydroxyhepta-2,4-diene-1,7-dioate isomerase
MAEHKTQHMAAQPLAGKAPSKIIAVHVSYRSRAMERGRLPLWPSYFLKPPSTLAADGDPVRRPPGCELLAFEGEVALVIGTRASRVSPADAWEYVGWVTAANDFGVYDLRYADGGSNVRSKGIDGFTPFGPGLLDARAVDPERISLRTWVNGTLVQDAVSGDDLLFSFAEIVADISRLTTLEPGDVILTGTPTGSTVVRPGDLVEVEVRGRVSRGDDPPGEYSNFASQEGSHLPEKDKIRVFDPPAALPRDTGPGTTPATDDRIPRGDDPPNPPAALPRDTGPGITPATDDRIPRGDDPPNPPAALPRDTGPGITPATDDSPGGEGWISTGRLRSPVEEADYDLSPPGAMPNPDDTQREAAYGAGGAPGPSGSPADLLRAVSQVSTATLSSQLRKRGFNSVTLDRLHATRPDRKMAGFARTLRYVPFREDLFSAYGGTPRGGGLNAQKRAVEQVRPGEVLVIEARGDLTAGTVGDILALRAQVRGAAGIVTDGAIRDSQALHAMDLPVYYGATHPAVLGRRHVPWEVNTTIACAGVTVTPGDIVVGDGDGVIVIPAHLAAEVAQDAAEQERQEEFAAAMVAKGESVDGLYPLGKRWQAAYETWLAEREREQNAG